MRRQDGFSLAELAVVLVIAGLMLGSIMYSLSAQTEVRNYDETQRRLVQARELLLSYAIVNGRLPCPARCAGWPSCTTSSAEVQINGSCTDGTTEDYYGGCLDAGACAGTYSMGGLLPAQTIGYQQVDAAGFAVDAWGNRIRYAVAKTVTGTSCTYTLPFFTKKDNLRAGGVTCQPNDLLVCKSSTSMTTSDCGSSLYRLTAQNLVVAIVFSTGKNGGTSPSGAGVDEAANVKTTTLTPKINPVFVWHAATSSDAANGEFDDLMLWIPVGELYSRLVSAGMLP